MTRRYQGDPYWITARFAGECAGCGEPVRKGARAFYYPKGKRLYGPACGCAERAARDFESAAADEDYLNCAL